MSHKKFPHCDQPVQSGWVACPACGFPLDSEGEEQRKECLVQLKQDLNRVSEEYRLLISQEKGVFSASKKNSLKIQCATEKNQIIQNVIVGNSRSELLELLAFSRPKANKNGPKKGYTTSGDYLKAEDFGYAYWTLYESCIFAAKAGFGSDPAFAPYFAYYEEEKSKKPSWLKFILEEYGTIIYLSTAFIVLLAFCLIMVFIS